MLQPSRRAAAVPRGRNTPHDDALAQGTARQPFAQRTHQPAGGADQTQVRRCVSPFDQAAFRRRREVAAGSCEARASRRTGRTAGTFAGVSTGAAVSQTQVGVPSGVTRTRRETAGKLTARCAAVAALLASRSSARRRPAGTTHRNRAAASGAPQPAARTRPGRAPSRQAGRAGRAGATGCRLCSRCGALAAAQRGQTALDEPGAAPVAVRRPDRRPHASAACPPDPRKAPRTPPPTTNSNPRSLVASARTRSISGAGHARGLARAATAPPARSSVAGSWSLRLPFPSRPSSNAAAAGPAPPRHAAGCTARTSMVWIAMADAGRRQRPDG